MSDKMEHFFDQVYLEYYLASEFKRIDFNPIEFLSLLGLFDRLFQYIDLGDQWCREINDMSAKRHFEWGIKLPKRWRDRTKERKKGRKK